METEIKRFIQLYDLKNQLSIVAVSGGLDSVVLLDLLQKQIPRKYLVVVHVNHGLRLESDNEAKAVKSLAEGYGLTFYSKKLNLQRRDEATARGARYRWLRELKQDIKASFIITAHHLDDQIETVLLNLARGVGPMELWGMTELSDDILRPLLNFPKDDLISYAKEQKLIYCEDESNQSVEYARNRIRHRVVPELRLINPAIYEVFSREVALGQEAKNYLEQQTEQLQERSVNLNYIDLKELKKAHPYIQKELIKKMLQNATGKKADIYQKNVSTVLELINKNGSKFTEIGGIKVEKTYNNLIFDPSPNKARETVKRLSYGKNEFIGSTITLKKGQNVKSKEAILLPESFSDNLKVRTWRAGDKIKTNIGTKKLQDVFTDAKINRSERITWPIITYGEEIVWVVGLQAAKIEGKDKTLIVEVK